MSSASAGCTTPAVWSMPVSMMATFPPLPVMPAVWTEATPVRALAWTILVVTVWSSLIAETNGFWLKAASDAWLTSSATAGMLENVETTVYCPAGRPASTDERAALTSRALTIVLGSPPVSNETMTRAVPEPFLP